MSRTLKIVLVFLFVVFILPIILIVLYYAYISIGHHLIDGSSESKKVAEIALSQKDPSVCGEIRTFFWSFNSEISLQNECYSAVAIGLREKNICENVQFGSKKMCYLQMAHLLSDETICPLTEGLQKSCYGGVAKQKKDISICENVTDQLVKDRCYSEINEVIGDPSICENNVQSVQEKDSCYFSVIRARAYENKSSVSDRAVCEKIKEEDLKGRCIRYSESSTPR